MQPAHGFGEDGADLLGAESDHEIDPTGIDLVD